MKKIARINNMLDKCKNCGGNLTFSPKNKGNRCERCGSVFVIPYTYEFQKKSFDMANIEDDKNQNLNSRNSEILKCESCGANLTIAENHVQTYCPYCGSAVFVNRKAPKMINIDSIIPFSYDKNEALKVFNHAVLRRFYANKKVFKKLTIENIDALYVNAFVFDFLTSTTYHGTFSYTVTEKDADGKESMRTVYKNVNGIFDKKFDNITIEANSNLEQKDLAQVMPFEYASAVLFRNEFMNGYTLEYQDKLFTKCVEQAKNRISDLIKHELLVKHKCDEIVTINLDTLYLDKKYNYCLLPVYCISNVYKEKKYKAFMNGQTGKVGKLPSSPLRVFFTFLFSLILIIGIIILSVIFAK